MLHSSAQRLVSVELPYAGRQRYMHGFDLDNPVMAEGFEDYLEPVSILIARAKVFRPDLHGEAFMTVDEKIVLPGMSQRRPGPHVDGQFMGREWKHNDPWNHYCNNVPTPRMSVIVAASAEGCRVWEGDFDGAPTESGDLSHIRDQPDAARSFVVPANVGYMLSPDCVHESMIFSHPTRRTFLRIALPVA